LRLLSNVFTPPKGGAPPRLGNIVMDNNNCIIRSNWAPDSAADYILQYDVYIIMTCYNTCTYKHIDIQRRLCAVYFIRCMNYNIINCITWTPVAINCTIWSGKRESVHAAVGGCDHNNITSIYNNEYEYNFLSPDIILCSDS